LKTELRLARVARACGMSNGSSSTRTSCGGASLNGRHT
jgi:hypothetical protein